MKIKILSDSTCDLSQALLDKYDVAITPLSVHCGERVGADGTDITPEDIYAYVEQSSELPKTSAVNVFDYLEAFRHWVDQGYEVVHFSISADFSSTYQNACLAAKELGSVYVVDSRNLSTGQGLLVLRAAELAEEGLSAQELAERCRAMTDQVEASFIIDRLDYLYKGGRCSALSAFGANLLRIKPCIEVRAGKMLPTKKYRGPLDKVLLQYVEDRLSGREDLDLRRIFITHTTCEAGLVEAVEEKIRALVPGFEEILETTAGATVTSHCGPNTLGILFMTKA